MTAAAIISIERRDGGKNRGLERPVGARCCIKVSRPFVLTHDGASKRD
jgi:hypothetical protein